MKIYQVKIEGTMNIADAFHFGFFVGKSIWLHYILEPFLNWMRLKQFYNARHTRMLTSLKSITKTTALIP
jgi:hypothetical protein